MWVGAVLQRGDDALRRLSGGKLRATARPRAKGRRLLKQLPKLLPGQRHILDDFLEGTAQPFECH